MPTITDELLVHFLVTTVSCVSLGHVLFSRKSTAPIAALLILCFGMLSYTVIPPLVSIEHSTYWYDTPPPQSVSRTILATILLICMISWWRKRHVRLKASHLILFSTAVALTLFSSFLSFTILPHLGYDNFLLQLKFSTVFCFYIGLSCVVSTLLIPARHSCRELNALFRIFILLGAISILIAMLEVGLDVANVRNFVRGSPELRASSVFANPNWFALSLSIALYPAVHLAFQRKHIESITLFVIFSSALILSGSRSALIISLTSFVVLIISLLLVGRSSYKVTTQAVVGVI